MAFLEGVVKGGGCDSDAMSMSRKLLGGAGAKGSALVGRTFRNSRALGSRQNHVYFAK